MPLVVAKLQVERGLQEVDTQLLKQLQGQMDVLPSQCIRFSVGHSVERYQQVRPQELTQDYLHIHSRRLVDLQITIS